MESSKNPIPTPAPETKPGPAAAPQSPEHAHAVDVSDIPRDLPRPGALTIIALTLLFLVLVAGLYVIGWLPHHAADVQIQADSAELASDLPIVTVAQPIPAASSNDLILPCDVRADQETAIFPRTVGYLKARYVDIQARVKANQVLADIDSPEIDTQLEQARGALEQAQAGVVKSEADLKLAQATLDRYYTLQKTGGNIVTRQEVEEKENAHEQSAGALLQAKANVIAAKATVDRFVVLQSFEKVTAPFEGVITARNYDVGALLSPTDVAPGREMFRIAKIDPLRVFVYVPQVHSGNIKIGSVAFLSVRNHPEVQGVVVRKADALDQNTRTMLFELQFANPDGTLYPGMYGQARVQLSQDHTALTVPVSALRFDANGVQLAIVRDSIVHMQKVTLGRDLGTMLEILDGLSPTNQVVTNLGERVGEGSRVKVQIVPPAAVAPSATTNQASPK